MSVLKPTSVPTKVLAESINASATSFKLNNIKGWDAADLVSGDFGITVYAVFRNSTNTAMELMEIDPTTIASASITITRRGLQFDGDLTTEVTANKLTWNKGDTFVDIGAATPQLWQWLKEYIDAASIAGAVPAANATAGIIKIATATELDADTEDDGTYDYVPNPATLAASKYGTRLPSADEKAAMAGGGDWGTPSTDNKFITEEYITSRPEAEIVVFTSSGTWTKDAGLKYIIVEGVGAGGSSLDSSFGTGGGGGYFKKLIPASALGSTETVTIGAAGNPGGDTSFGSHATGNGGTASTGDSSGGSASGGDINIPGSGGEGGSGGTGGNYPTCGTSVLSNGPKPSGYGSGGAGSANGTSGIVIVTEYYI